ncbi:MAG TPA: hypothetical protein PKO09_09575 [Anaerolineae bacterium]|nr:hypothetical protein [Anaerolineae bacterium]
MRSVVEALHVVLRRPTAAALLDLQGALLSVGIAGPEAGRAMEITGQFHTYLSQLESKIAARDYSELASRLDTGAVGMVAVENLVSNRDEKLWQRLVAGGLGEGLMVAASRQYVKAWQAEAGLVHRNAAWFLAGQLWDLSRQMQPNLPNGQRWRMVQKLLEPAHDAEVPEPSKALLIGRIFQSVLLIVLGRLLAG